MGQDSGEQARPGPRPATADASPRQASELILRGRRYLMVPVDGGGPANHAEPTSPAGQEGWVERLTARELQITALIAEGLVNKQIAAELRISEWTVSTHIRRIFSKLHVDTRAAMVGRCAGVLSRLAGKG
jgi:DNA-binding NarL/FixJ family response regulator